MDFRDTVAAFRAGWFLPVIGLLLGGAAGAGMAMTMTPTYTSSTQLFVTSTDATTTTAAFQGSQFSQNRVASYVQVLTSERLAVEVVDTLDLDLTPDEVQSRIEASVVPDTTVLDIVITDTSPERARDLAEAVATQFAELVDVVEATTTTPTEPEVEPVTTVPVKVTVLDSPEIPEEPASPNLYSNIAVGLLIGLLVGLALAYARVRLDRSVRDGKVAAAAAGAPLIGTITRDRRLEHEHVLDRRSRSGNAESFRQLRTNLQFLDVDAPPRVIMVSSAVGGEGKSTLAANLAVTLAEGGHRVTLVEADLRHPRITRYLGLVDGAGLTSVLSGAADLDDVLQTYGKGSRKLSVLSAGAIPPNPSELLASSQLGALVDRLRAANDYVVVDTPPLLPVSDGSAVAVVMDGVLLSVRQGKTSREELQQARALLDRVGARTLGVVLNIAPASADPAHAYGYQGEAPTGDSDVDDDPDPAPAGRAAGTAPAAVAAEPAGATRLEQPAAEQPVAGEPSAGEPVAERPVNEPTVDLKPGMTRPIPAVRPSDAAELARGRSNGPGNGQHRAAGEPAAGPGGAGRHPGDLDGR
ncbi:polysaccharide biosynthesis tyrosine autokinase [Blastococcus sp. VKM Ac-2987]|uniref:polysaccharide biosynthesis tyrosine autokinase n=1 Tax=Blastococcus sp. VKM Ac-2987 TaxID=3004141 RepID=UPI0022AB6CC6|nr:polysaccharide biosynthesis tyrosine autokinase [Blastococcus sp. VKM Ac-2987]MCZ2858459.1 polysaccharide biosynthesis tyrosine autokinase [Blastococcus sp. VKM Ac-2987]